MRYNYMPTGMAKMKKAENTKSWEEYKETGYINGCNYFGKLLGSVYQSWMHDCLMTPKFHSSQKSGQS